MRLAASVSIAVLLATTLATPVEAQVAIATPDPAIVRLLADAGRAFETDDRELHRGTFSAGPFADERLRAFDNAVGIAFAEYRFEVTTQYSGDLASPRVRAHYPGREVVAYHVLERSRVEGIESIGYLEDSFFTFVRERDDAGDRYRGWRMASDDDFDVLGLPSAGHIWDAAPVRVTRGARFAALHHADVAAEAKDIVAMADAVYGEVDAFWPRRIDDRFVIVVPSQTAELGRILRSTYDLSKFVAFAAGGADRSEGWEPAAARIYVHLQRFRRHEAAFKRETMAHELIHAVTREVSGPFVPVWIEEGLASIGSEEGTGIEGARGGPRPSDFPADDEFSVGATRDIVRIYHRSQVAMSILLQRLGIDGLAAFYEALGAVRVAPGTATYHLGQAAERAGWSADAWRKAWIDRIG